jgi:hypothetical protein
MSMRDALLKLHASADSADATQRLLQLLSQYCQITDASLHAVTDEQLQPHAIAHIGSPDSVDAGCPGAPGAEMRRLCHVVESTAEGRTSRYLVAAPLLDLQGDLYALLVVREMPFFALQTENLQVINLLLSYYTDGLSAHELTKPVLTQFPDCPDSFAMELQRLSHMQQSSGISSVVLALEFSQEAIARNVPQQVVRMKRMLDEVWLTEPQAGKQVVAILMPLAPRPLPKVFCSDWSNGRSAASSTFP